MPGAQCNTCQHTVQGWSVEAQLQAYPYNISEPCFPCQEFHVLDGHTEGLGWLSPRFGLDASRQHCLVLWVFKKVEAKMLGSAGPDKRPVPHHQDRFELCMILLLPLSPCLHRKHSFPIIC